MDFKLNKEEICALDIILDTKQEQSVELDYVLPDYYAEIFRICKCIVVPRIASYSINGDKLMYDISVLVRILYCSEDSNAVKVIEQKLMYSKTADIGCVPSDPDVSIIPHMDYINCRAVNQRRIDLRGAVTINIKLSDISRRELISDAFGMDIQLKKVPVTYPVNRLFASKLLTVTDEFELGMSKPSIDSIISCDAVVASTDKKVIANKMVAKGELNVNMLYTFNEGESSGIESMQFTMPFSQIIELEGVDERYDCFVDADVMSCEIEPHSDGEGNSKIAECKAVISLKCHACRTASVELAVDEYSSAYKTSHSLADVKIESVPQPVNYSGMLKMMVNTGEDSIGNVYFAKCSIKNYSVSPDSNGASVNGTVICSVLVCGEDGTPYSVEKEEAFSIVVPMDNTSENCVFDVKVYPLSCSYTMVSDNEVEIKTDIKVSGTVCCTEYFSGIDSISVDEASAVEHNKACALKLYFADAGESVWEISKHYRTSPDAVINENDLDSDTLADSRMLIIPII